MKRLKTEIKCGLTAVVSFGLTNVKKIWAKETELFLLCSCIIPLWLLIIIINSKKAKQTIYFDQNHVHQNQSQSKIELFCEQLENFTE